MKKLIAMVMAVFIFANSVNHTSFAEEIKNANEQSEVFQATEAAPEKASDVFNLENQKSSLNISDNIDKGETMGAKISAQQNLNKASAYKEKNIKKLKDELKNCNENMQKKIQEYENMTDKKFRCLKFFGYILGFLIDVLIIGTFVVTYSYGIDKTFYKGQECRNENIKYQEGYASGFLKGQKEGIKKSSTDKCNNISPDTRGFVKKILVTLHPDSFGKKGKTFNDVKSLYDSANNFYEKHLKNKTIKNH